MTFAKILAEEWDSVAGLLPMANFPTASELAAAVGNRQMTCVEAVEAHLERIRLRNPALNAVVTLDEEGARRRAVEADAELARGEPKGPLHGVPFTVKDSFETAGVRTTAGYPRFADHVPEADAPVVARLRAAGAILLGKTNLPPLASGNQTNNPIFGRTNNPWDLTRTPGGSSGGSAAAVAAGLSAFDLGSDVGGSIRGPAHLCGVCGFKPSAGSLPLAGNLASARPFRPGPLLDVMGQFPVYGPIARSAEDLRLVFSALQERSLTGLPPQLAALRLAWTDTIGLPMSASVRSVIANAVDRLGAAGAQLERHASPGFDWDQAWATTGICIGAFETRRNPLPRRLLFRVAGPLLARRMGGGTLVESFFAGARSGERELGRAFAQREQLVGQVEAFLGGFDAWIGPVLPVEAYPHCRPGGTLAIEGRRVAETFLDLAYSGPFNLTGHPSVVIPAGHGEAGLPVGVQIVGRRGDDARLLALAQALDRALGAGRAPPAA
jgi:amidase